MLITERFCTVRYGTVRYGARWPLSAEVVHLMGRLRPRVTRSGVGLRVSRYAALFFPSGSVCGGGVWRVVAVPARRLRIQRWRVLAVVWLVVVGKASKNRNTRSRVHNRHHHHHHHHRFHRYSRNGLRHHHRSRHRHHHRRETREMEAAVREEARVHDALLKTQPTLQTKRF